MKTIDRSKVIFTFSRRHKPAERVRVGETIRVETEDAFSGQIRSEKDSVEMLDWSKVDGATGPIFVDGAEPRDTLVVEILDIKVPKKGVIVTVPKQGILREANFGPSTRMVDIEKDHVVFDKARVRTRPMIGTIGVTPEAEIPCGSLGKHGGNMDVKELTAETKLYLPVSVEGALFAAGDVHAVQSDGEVCVSAVEVPAEILMRFNVIKGVRPEWPVLETRDSYAVLTCGEILDEAVTLATQAAVNGLMNEYKWKFEEAYMFASLAVDLEINQVVDPKKGVRAVISKDLVTLESLLRKS